MIIHAFGDSITYGQWDLTNGGWATQLRLLVDEKRKDNSNYYGLVYNLGIPGETTDGLVKRFMSEFEQRERKAKAEENIFIFAYGANDACLVPSKNEFLVPTSRFFLNLETVIIEAKRHSSKILLLNITPVIDKLTVSPEGKDKSRLNQYITPYNEDIRRLAENYHLETLDINDAFMKIGHEGLFCSDGLHPNEKGHELIFNMVKRYLSTKEWI